MLKKFLREVIVIVVGKQAEEIAELLDSKKYINEFLIAKKMDITINQARNILYKLSDYGLVSSIRKKDKKKGWYTYFWRIEILKSLEFLRSILIKKIEQLNHQMKSREIKTFYVCKRCNVEFNEENALNNDFTCNECGGVFAISDNTNILKEYKRNLSKLRKELGFIEIEIKKEKEKIEKQKLKEAKKKEISVTAKKLASQKKRAKLKPGRSKTFTSSAKRERKRKKPTRPPKKKVKKLVPPNSRSRSHQGRKRFAKSLAHPKKKVVKKIKMKKKKIVKKKIKKSVKKKKKSKIKKKKR